MVIEWCHGKFPTLIFNWFIFVLGGDLKKLFSELAIEQELGVLKGNEQESKILSVI